MAFPPQSPAHPAAPGSRCPPTRRGPGPIPLSKPPCRSRQVWLHKVPFIMTASGRGRPPRSQTHTVTQNCHSLSSARRLHHSLPDTLKTASESTAQFTRTYAEFNHNNLRGFNSFPNGTGGHSCGGEMSGFLSHWTYTALGARVPGSRLVLGPALGSSLYSGREVTTQLAPLWTPHVSSEE